MSGITESLRTHAFSGIKGVLNIAHRGGAELYPENTMVAFEAAVTQFRCPVLEIDVHLLRDGQVVVIHDPTVDRTTDGHGQVADMYWEDVAHLDAAYHFRERRGGAREFRGQGIHIPRLEDVLNSFPETRFNIDLKARDPRLVEAVADIIKTSEAEDRVCVGSEFDEMGEALQLELPMATHFLPRNALAAWVQGVMSGQAQPSTSKYRVLNIPFRYKGVELVTPELLNQAAENMLWVNVWTVNARTDMERLIDWGVGGIITDRPDTLADILERRYTGLKED